MGKFNVDDSSMKNINNYFLLKDANPSLKDINDPWPVIAILV